MRRLAITNQGPRTREIDVTSYVEIALAPPAADLAHPAFGKLFLETEYAPASSALLCHRRPRDPGEAPIWAVHVLSLEGRTQGPIEWETDRARFLGRGRDPARARGARRPHAVGHHRRRARSRSSACASASGSRPARPCACRLRPVSPAIATPPTRSRRSTANPARPCARSRSRSGTRKARCTIWRSPTTTRCCSSGSPRACCAPTGRSARPETCSRATSSASPGCGGTASRAICPSCSSTSSAPTRCRSCGRCCRRRSTGA